MGTVYKIEHVITRRIEAMKLLPAGLGSDAEQARRFEREIQVQARLHHPNIVALYNAIRDGESIALVMEFVEGESLRGMLERGPLPVATAVDFAMQILGALAYAHEAGVIHRDVSPANIIVTPERVAKLTDFGLALGATDLRLSTSGVPLGSPWYMSPEQVRGIHELDARTDIYAVGAVLHEMLTGRKLFEAEGAFAVMRAHVETTPAAASSLNPLVPTVLDDIVGRAVAKDPAMRFHSADEFRLALENCVVAPTKKAGLASRKLVLMALAPAVVVAGMYAALSPRVVVRHRPVKASVAVVNREAERPVPAIVAPVEAPAAPVETPVVLPPVKSGLAARRRAAPRAQSTALRIVGGETVPSAAPPASAHIMEAPEPAAHSASPDAPPAVIDPAATSQAPANPQNGGNRLVRALGKVNPFRKRTKADSSKEDVKK